MKYRVRWNVLALICMGYVAVLIVFGFVSFLSGATVAYETINSPLMALVGGSLAIAKDLVQLDAKRDEDEANGNGKH